MADITDFDYRHAEKVWKDFKIENLGEYHDLVTAIHYYFQIFLRILKINVLKYMNLIRLIFYQHLDYYGKLV